MTKIQRNAPCPCGSGRKQKHCCGTTTTVGDFTRARNLRCEIDLGQKAIAWATRKYGEQSVEEAWIEFSLGLLGIPLHDLDEMAPFSALFFPWWLYGGSVDDEGARSPVVEYLDSCRTPAGSFERQMARTIAESPFSFHRVTDVDAGRSMTLEDVFTGQGHVVQEKTGSVEQARSTYLFARVAVIDGVAGLYGNGPFLVEPSSFLELKTLRDRLIKQVGRTLTESDLHEFDIEIRALYLSIVARILDPSPPQLVNTEGDPLAPTTLVYDLECDCEHAFEKLRTLAKGHKKSALLDDAELDAAGRLTHISFPWIDSRKPGSPGMGPLILGYVSIETGRLEVEVNSAERADRIRSRISRRLGAKARFHHAVIESIEEMLSERAGSHRSEASGEGGLAPDQSTPEIQAAIAETMKRRWAAWFDESIPALEGLTPRQAAKSEEGRELLEALLANYDRLNQQMPGSPTNPNTSELRRELGLE
ncbi:SEC-C metal-binding domain-containing protein [bacterium]|nr:SEC-C metal-binding domain-containing protein [bacterium]